MLFIPNVILVVLASLIVNLTTTVIEWFLVYRTEDFKRLSDEIKESEKKVETLKKNKESVIVSNTSLKKDDKAPKNSKDRQIEAYQKRIKDANQQLTMFRMKSTLATGVVMFSAFGMMSSAFDGLIVAKLPFHPFGLLQGMSHRNLPGTDETDCSFLFIYVLASMTLRASIQKYLGWTQATPSMFQMPEEFNEESK
ncbi:hypothetical protein AKO1_013518 [Acrasis kona]|uniref:CLAC channel n=1 Tax=Acrasis kona TaxID=1008807 RepID=A0AAW2ZJU8_9EUKA